MSILASIKCLAWFRSRAFARQARDAYPLDERAATQTASHAAEAAAHHAAARSEAWNETWKWEGHPTAIEVEAKGGPDNAYAAALDAARNGALEAGRIAERDWQRLRFGDYSDRSESTGAFGGADGRGPLG